MKIVLNKNNRNGLADIICLNIIISVIGLVIFGIKKANFITRINDICWIILIVALLIINSLYGIRKKQTIFAVLLFLQGIIGQIHCYFATGYFELSNMFRPMFFSCIYFAICAIHWRSVLHKKSINKVMLTIVVIGVISVLYAYIEQGYLIATALKGNSLSNWLFRSFYATRNNYAMICVLAIIASTYFYVQLKRKIFILLDFILILQVILTNSRNAQVAILVFACVFFLLQFSPRIRIVVIVSVILCSGIFIFYILSDDVWMTLLLERFLHTNASMSGQDSSIIRFQMWYDACLCLSENIAWLCGMGDSYVSEYLLQKYSLGSSHNVFMDLLFTGGLVRLGIYIATLIDAYKVICKIKDFVIRNVLIATFYTVIVHSFFDSFTIMFQSGYYSVIVTLLIVFIPQYYEGGDVVNV